MSSGQDEPPSKPCHNCRRRRLKCDRTLPGCRKCSKTGQECLGYGKLFLWDQGVASRGKMMGKTIPVQTPAKPPRRDDVQAMSAGLGTGMDTHQHGSNMTSQELVLRIADEFCKSLVTYDMPNLNPFRDLIPLTREHAVLLHMAIANSAVHMANRYAMETQSAAVAAQSLKGIAPGQSSVIHSQPLQELSGQAARFYHDALVAKQKALRLLRHALQHVNTGNRDVLLAAIHLFANFELITSGKGDCIVHVEGARRLIECFGPESSSPMMGKLRDYVVSDCLTFYILGSMVASSRSRANANRHFQYVLPLLERAESNSYLSCPSVLLQIMLSASYLSSGVHSTPSEASSLAEEAAALLSRAQAFDIHAWAQGVQGISSQHADDFESRVHVASAHKSAICLYIHRAVQPTAHLLDAIQIEALVADVIHHLALIGRDDSLIKGTAWPTFVAGAESEEPERRAWVADRLVMLWRIMLWGYLPTALETLQALWSTDGVVCPVDGVRGAKEGWLQKLKRLGIEWMIV
ncbi:hypothetical protein SLS55_005668 [Diplodia seriata]|uniref:Zn(2)-C6 fungal-type domain-containing protein n=2 Tax=Diplodia seriata TaxID=420778 RepID=A0ABR3CH26_9PEZI